MSIFCFRFFSFIFDNICRKLLTIHFYYAIMTSNLTEDSIMSNASATKGTYTFNFSNVENVTPREVTTCIRKFILALEL